MISNSSKNLPYCGVLFRYHSQNKMASTHWYDAGQMDSSDWK